MKYCCIKLSHFCCWDAMKTTMLGVFGVRPFSPGGYMSWNDGCNVGLNHFHSLTFLSTCVTSTQQVRGSMPAFDPTEYHRTSLQNSVEVMTDDHGKSCHQSHIGSTAVNLMFISMILLVHIVITAIIISVLLFFCAYVNMLITTAVVFLPFIFFIPIYLISTLFVLSSFQSSSFVTLCHFFVSSSMLSVIFVNVLLVAIIKAIVCIWCW